MSLVHADVIWQSGIVIECKHMTTCTWQGSLPFILIIHGGHDLAQPGTALHLFSSNIVSHAADICALQLLKLFIVAISMEPASVMASDRLTCCSPNRVTGSPIARSAVRTSASLVGTAVSRRARRSSTA